METKNKYQIQFGEHLINASPEQLSLKEISKLDKNTYHILHNGLNVLATVNRISLVNHTLELKIGRRIKQIKIIKPIHQLIHTLGYNSSKSIHSDALFSPMPGMVLDIHVAIGETISKGAPLITLEAMKMENILKATHDGTICEIRINKGDKVDKNQILLLFSEKV